jgi:hypothetical protein
MGKIGRTYPRPHMAQPVVPGGPGRLIFVRKALARRFAGFLWLTGFVSLLLFAWPST